MPTRAWPNASRRCAGRLPHTDTDDVGQFRESRRLPTILPHATPIATEKAMARIRGLDVVVNSQAILTDWLFSTADRGDEPARRRDGNRACSLLALAADQFPGIVLGFEVHAHHR